MPVLQYLDVVLGLAVVMLILATVVASASQTILTFFLVRARYLVDSLDGLLAQSLGDAQNPTPAKDISALLRSMLSDPRLGRKSGLFGLVKNFNRRFKTLSLSPPDSVRREEFFLILLEKLSSTDKLPASLKFDPKAALQAIRNEMLALEKQFPTLPASEWRTKAILKVATEATSMVSDADRQNLSKLVGTVFDAFDNTMDRVADNTSQIGRLWAFGVAFLVVFSLGVDTLDLINRLTLDESARKELVQIAISDDLTKGVEAKAQEILKTNRFSFGTTPVQLQCTDDRIPDAVEMPARLLGHYMKFPGVWITWVLVSLGAPFWQEMIRKLVGMRDLVTHREEQARAARESDQTPAART